MKNVVDARVKGEEKPKPNRLKVKKASFDAVLGRLVQSAPVTREAGRKKRDK